MNDKVREAFEEIELWLFFVILVWLDVTLTLALFSIEQTLTGISVSLKYDFSLVATVFVLKANAVVFVAMSAGRLWQSGQPGGSGGRTPGAASPPEES